MKYPLISLTGCVYEFNMSVQVACMKRAGAYNSRPIDPLQPHPLPSNKYYARTGPELAKLIQAYLSSGLHLQPLANQGPGCTSYQQIHYSAEIRKLQQRISIASSGHFYPQFMHIATIGC